MTQQQVSAICLSVKDAVEGFLLDMGASRRSPSTIEAYRIVLRFLAEHAEKEDWPSVDQISVRHLRSYFASIQERPRWCGKRDTSLKPISSSYYETNYRRIKRFFNWLVEEGEIPINPMARVQHPKIEERVIPVVSDSDFTKLLRLTNPELYRTQAEKFRAYRDHAVLWLLCDTSGRREGIIGISVDDVDLQQHRVLVMEKGRKERYLFIGNTTAKALWRYMREREKTHPFTGDLWVDAKGAPMIATWLNSC
jgi:site-specific recombinase XerD